MKNFSPSLFQILSDMRVSQPQHLMEAMEASMEAMEASMASICCDLHCMEAAEARGDSGPYNTIPQVEEASGLQHEEF